MAFARHTHESSASASIASLLRQHATHTQLASFLHAMSRTERAREVLSLGGRQVAQLYDACAGCRPLSLEDFVREDEELGRTVVFQGRNSLPHFTSFQKRFARVAGGEIVGYNHQTFAFATGPGFFVVRPAAEDTDVPGELYFDYTAAPSEVPEGWPAYRPNDAGLSNLVYKDMKDYMRAVADDVVVGKAFKRGKAQGAWFLLVRAS